MLKFKSILTKISNQFLNIFDLEVKPKKYNHPEPPGFSRGLSQSTEEKYKSLDNLAYNPEREEKEFNKRVLNKFDSISKSMQKRQPFSNKKNKNFSKNTKK